MSSCPISSENMQLNLAFIEEHVWRGNFLEIGPQELTDVTAVMMGLKFVRRIGLR